MSHERDQAEMAALELYKVASARLNLQDEYLFKFSALFVTVHGALAVLAGRAFFERTPPEYMVLLITGSLGTFLALVWALWTQHNGYWHRVWIGVLRDIEENHLPTDARVFFRDRAKDAKRAIFSPKMRGHSIALILPAGFAVAWFLVVLLAVFRL